MPLTVARRKLQRYTRILEDHDQLVEAVREARDLWALLYNVHNGEFVPEPE